MNCFTGTEFTGKQGLPYLQLLKFLGTETVSWHTLKGLLTELCLAYEENLRKVLSYDFVHFISTYHEIVLRVQKGIYQNYLMILCWNKE